MITEDITDGAMSWRYSAVFFGDFMDMHVSFVIAWDCLKNCKLYKKLKNV